MKTIKSLVFRSVLGFKNQKALFVSVWILLITGYISLVSPPLARAVVCGGSPCTGTCVTICDNDCSSTSCKTTPRQFPNESKNLFAFLEIKNAHAIIPNPPGCIDVCNPPSGSCSLNGSLVPDGTGPLIKQNGRCKKCNGGSWIQKDCSHCGKCGGMGVCSDCPTSSSSASSISVGSANTVCTDSRGNPIPCSSSNSSSTSNFSFNSSLSVSFSFSFPSSSSRSSRTSASSTPSASTSSSTSASSTTSGSNSSASSSNSGGGPGGGVLPNVYCNNNCRLYKDTWKNCKPGFVLRTYKHCSGTLGQICVPAKTTKTQYTDPRCGTPVPNRVNP